MRTIDFTRILGISASTFALCGFVFAFGPGQKYFASSGGMIRSANADENPSVEDARRLAARRLAEAMNRKMALQSAKTAPAQEAMAVPRSQAQLEIRPTLAAPAQTASAAVNALAARNTSGERPLPAAVSAYAGQPAADAAPKMAADETQRLYKRAEALVRDGDMASARLLLERTAEAGHPGAMYMLASTYDPNVLNKVNVLGLRGDVQRARMFYERALQSGIGDARQRLAALAE